MAQEDFIKRMEVVVKRKNEKEILVEEGWCTKDEMMQDLGWSETFVYKASHKCFRIPETASSKSQTSI